MMLISRPKPHKIHSVTDADKLFYRHERMARDMTMLKQQAVEILQGIPDDKFNTVIEILKALRALYAQGGESTISDETVPNAMGIFSKYANPSLIFLEKDAWGEAVKEKHAVG